MAYSLTHLHSPTQTTETVKTEQMQRLGIEVVNKRGKEMGKDQFLQLLVTQLTHQDPLKPVEDKEFISQMAQFSALEQMTEVNKNLANLNQRNLSVASFQLLGKEVEGTDSKGKLTRGLVNEIYTSGKETILRTVNGEININDVQKIFNHSTAQQHRQIESKR